jgi:hypothetical protein
MVESGPAARNNGESGQPKLILLYEWLNLLLIDWKPLIFNSEIKHWTSTPKHTKTVRTRAQEFSYGTHYRKQTICTVFSGDSQSIDWS